MTIEIEDGVWGKSGGIVYDVTNGDFRTVFGSAPLPPLARPSTVSHITVAEESEAKALIDAQFVEMTGKPMDMRPSGFYIVLKIYIPPESKDLGEGKKLFLADSTRDDRKYTSAIGLVCAVGPDAYTGERFERSGPWCKVGDWVAFPRYESIAMAYRGVSMAMLPDDRILCVVDDPADVQSINSASKF